MSFYISLCQCWVRPGTEFHFASSCGSSGGYQHSSFVSRVACVCRNQAKCAGLILLTCGLNGRLSFFSLRKWKGELLHYQDWDSDPRLTAGADSEGGVPSRTGCRKRGPHPWGAKFSQQGQRSAPLKQCSTRTSRSTCRGCVGRVCCARAGYEPSARSCTCHGTSATCGAGRVSMALLPALSPWFSSPGAKTLQFSACHRLESCRVYFNHPQFSTLSPAPWKILLTEGTKKVSNIQVCITSWLETPFCGSFQKDVYSIGFLSC